MTWRLTRLAEAEALQRSPRGLTSPVPGAPGCRLHPVPRGSGRARPPCASTSFSASSQLLRMPMSKPSSTSRTSAPMMIEAALSSVGATPPVRPPGDVLHTPRQYRRRRRLSRMARAPCALARRTSSPNEQIRARCLFFASARLPAISASSSRPRRGGENSLLSRLSSKKIPCSREKIPCSAAPEISSQGIESPQLFKAIRVPDGRNSRNSQFFSLIAGNCP